MRSDENPDWINDSPFGEWLSPRNCGCIELPFATWDVMANTAIALIYTPDGFALAADGRMCFRGEPFDENRKKIFPINDPTRKLACMWSGNVRLPEGESVIFDFALAGEEAAEALSKRNPPGLARYADLLAEKIYRALLAKRLAGYPDEDGRGTVVNLIVAGYYDGVPSFARVRFYQRNRKLAYPLIDESEIFHSSHRKLSGSPAVAELLFNDVPSPLAIYRSAGFEKLRNGNSLTFEEARDVATNFILACSSNEAKRLDDRCKTVGGHLHSATITLSDGFKWDKPPVEGQFESIKNWSGM